jgi:two-component system, response regulator
LAGVSDACLHIHFFFYLCSYKSDHLSQFLCGNFITGRLIPYKAKTRLLLIVAKSGKMQNLDSIDILVVEDNPYDAELFVRSMKKLHPEEQVFVAENGEEALNFIFCRENFSTRSWLKPLKVIFLDLKLPKVNGLEVLKEVKSNPETTNLPVVILTSSREEQDIKAAYEAGANSYVVKPVDYNLFLEIIGNTISYWLSVNEIPK